MIERIFSVTCPRRSWCGRHCGKTEDLLPPPRPSLEPVTSLPLPFHTPSGAISMFYSLPPPPPPQSSFGLQCHSFDRQKGRNRATEMRPAGKRGSVYSGERPIRHQTLSIPRDLRSAERCQASRITKRKRSPCFLIPVFIFSTSLEDIFRDPTILDVERKYE